jgi:adenine/guanine phosphoribosyltransferase-like PRPP-binding protein
LTAFLRVFASGGAALDGVRLLRRLCARRACAAFVLELDAAGGREGPERGSVAVLSLLKVPKYV